MQKLQLNYVTWERPDANGLFDYQSILQIYSQIIIQVTGYIYRNINNYNLIFVPLENKRKYDDNQNYHKILKINKKDNHYFIQRVQITKQPLCKIVSNEDSQAPKIILNDLIRMGKVEIHVLKADFKNKKFKCHYEQLKNQIQISGFSEITQITPSFYQVSDESPSLIAQNPSCRYCHCKTISNENHFIVSCCCKGYTRYVHEQCLLEWITKRGKLSEVKDKRIFYIQSNVLKCELCHEHYEIHTMFTKLFNYQKNLLKMSMGQLPQQLMILRFKFEMDYLFFIDISISKQLCIGRSIQCDIILNQLSVSRKHAFVRIDSQAKIITLKDNKSKFGTLIEIKKAQIQANQTYQVGRSKINFKKIKKKTIFDRIGLCFIQEKLRNEKKKV